MSYNGSGTFNINSTGQPVVAGTVITASAFNALTTDLATGLTTAITKDGQTTTTARITFAQGITSSLVTDSSSISTGSIITGGGVGIAKALYVGTTANVAGAVTLGGIATFSAQPIFSSLTASSAVATDASKGLVSVTNTGTGNNVLATSPTITTPVISLLSSASATALTLQSAGTTAITVDTSQNVGIGTATPATKLEVASPASTSVVLRLASNKTGTGAGDKGRLDFYSADNSGTAYQLGYMDYDRSDGTGTASYIAWANRVSGTVAERMRIDSSGNLLISGTSSTGTPAQGFQVLINGGETNIEVGHKNGTASGTEYLGCSYNSSKIGSITQNGTTGVLYNLTSDYRLKNNPVALTGAKNFVMALQPKKWQWWDGSGEGVGFIAHEFMEVAKYSGNGTKDAVDADGKAIHQSIQPSSSEVMANIVALMQEQQALIDTQAETINALTARIVALESK